MVGPAYKTAGDRAWPARMGKTPQDPSVDTFDDRFGAWNPLSKKFQEIKDESKTSYPVRPGTPTGRGTILD